MTDDLSGDVPWLLQKWEIPTLGAFFYLSIRLIVLVAPFLFFLLNLFVVSDCSKLEGLYHKQVQAALEFALTIKDFDNLVDPRHLYDCCLGPEPSAFVLKKIAQEEKSMLSLSSVLFFIYIFFIKTCTCF